MKETVIFPDPQDVNIIATRNGELTQIPGLQFRAPVAPYTAFIKANWYEYERQLILTYSTEITVKVHGLYQDNGWSLTPFAVPSEDSCADLGSSTITWKKHPKNYNSYPDPDSGIPMIVVAEINGYKTIETVEINDRYDKIDLRLPESVGSLVKLQTYNPGWSDDKWDW